MNRNTNEHFAQNPVTIDLPRSRFSRNFDVKGTCNTGELIPFFATECMPGGTYSLDTAKVVRMETPIFPFMDRMYMDTYYFFVPWRLIWDNFENFLGQDSPDAWSDPVEYTIPFVSSPATTGWANGTIADYFGFPTGVPGLKHTAMLFRAYAKLVDDWFRDENLTEHLNIPTGDSDQTGSNGTNYINDIANGGMPFKVSKSFDVFTGALPSPQKGPSVNISLAGLNAENVPVYGNGLPLGLTVGGIGSNNRGQLAVTSSSNWQVYPNAVIGSSDLVHTPSGVSLANENGTASYVGVLTKSQAGNYPVNSGLTADVSGLSTTDVISINQLRQAFQVQKFYEKSARGGTRYVELLRSMFGTRSADARLQRSEYLGGSRIDINVDQVVSTSETADRPQGSTAAYSLTTDYHSDTTYSTTEHGFIIGVFCIRYNHSYQQGINRMWLHRNRFDLYWPLLANIGEVGIKNQEIYAQGSSVINSDTNKPYDDEIFGYQEAWYEYRYHNSIVCSEMRSNYEQSLDVWHLADDYNQLPALSDEWIREDKTNVDRVLAVSSGLSHQFLYNFYVRETDTLPMPLYSIPGLIDHH